jgi:antibiotic biosynthesis monooxygenase (ABM) superfamily enzyme
MRKKKDQLAPPFAAETKDTRFAGTFEVMIPVEGRTKPHRVPLQFASKEEAESWIHSPAGKEMIREILSGG